MRSMKFELVNRDEVRMSKFRPFTVIPAKRSASRNPVRFGAYNCGSSKTVLDSRPGLPSAGVTFFRGNDVFKLRTSHLALRDSNFENEPAFSHCHVV